MPQLAVVLFLILLPFRALAAEVAFLEERLGGHLVQLEPNGRFFHVAIRYGDKWFHAHPHGGVTLIDDLDRYGDQIVVLRNDSVPGPTPAQVRRWLGKGFDTDFSWNNPYGTYCSRLVAEILGVPPQPMEF